MTEQDLEKGTELYVAYLAGGSRQGIVDWMLENGPGLLNAAACHFMTRTILMRDREEGKPKRIMATYVESK